MGILQLESGGTTRSLASFEANQFSSRASYVVRLGGRAKYTQHHKTSSSKRMLLCLVALAGGPVHTRRGEGAGAAMPQPLGGAWCVISLKRHSSIVRRPGRTCKQGRAPSPTDHPRHYLRSRLRAITHALYLEQNLLTISLSKI